MKTIFAIFFLLFCSCINAQKDKSYHNHWHEKGVDDFKSITSVFKFFKNGKFYYCISNDRDNIYIDLRIYDKDMQRKVLASGITIWINTNGKKSKKMGIRYPVRLQDRDRITRTGSQNIQGPPGMPEWGADPGGAMDINDLNTNSLQLIGFSESGPVTITSYEYDNFRGSIRIERDQNMYYEIIMPFAKLPTIIDKPPGKKKSGPFLLGISYTAEGSSSMNGPPAGGRTMPGESGGGGPGGGRPGGGRPGGSGVPSVSTTSQTSSSPNQLVFWIKDIRLATEK
jgi:hypothetical protein